MRKYKEPTSVRLVLEFLRKEQDIYTVHMISKATGVTVSRVSAAVYMLRDYRCVSPVLGDRGRVWWMPLPEHMDTRLRYLKERTPESKARKSKKPKQLNKKV